MTRAERMGFIAVLLSLVLIIVGVLIAASVGDVVGEAVPVSAGAASGEGVVLAWVARGLLVLSLAWAAIGMIAARTSLVGKPGAAAARATWLSATRPWRARESTLGMLRTDRWLLIVIPAGLLIATRALQTSFTAWGEWGIVLGAWIVFALVVRLFVGRRSPWPIIAAVGGVVILRCIVTLFALSFTGPSGYWSLFWLDPVRRTVYIALAFALFVWVFVAGAWALSVQIGRRRAIGSVLAGVGAAIAVPAVVVGIVGAEATVDVWNDRLGLFPWGLGRLVGQALASVEPWLAAGFGAVLALVGLGLIAVARGRAEAPQGVV